MTDIEDLIELCEEAMCYVSPYFRDKWEMNTRLAELKRRLTPVPADAAASHVAETQAQPEPTAVAGGTAEHYR